MILAEISLETEFKIQEIATLLFLIQELRSPVSWPSSLASDPSTKLKPNLCFAKRAIIIAQIRAA